MSPPTTVAAVELSGVALVEEDEEADDGEEEKESPFRHTRVCARWIASLTLILPGPKGTPALN